MYVGGGDFLWLYTEFYTKSPRNFEKWLYTEMKVEANVNASRLRKLSKLSEMGLLVVSNLLTGGGRGRKMMRVKVNLLMCNRRGSLYSVHATV